MSSMKGRRAGEGRDVLQHLLAAIAEAGRLDRADLERAAQLVDDQRGERLAVDVLGDDEERAGRLWRPARAAARESAIAEIFFSWTRMRGLSSSTTIFSGSVTKYGEKYPRSNCMPSTTSSSVSMPRFSSTVMTPSLPTFSIASARMSPIVGVAVGADRADLGDLFLVPGRLRELLELLDRSWPPRRRCRASGPSGCAPPRRA